MNALLIASDAKIHHQPTSHKYCIYRIMRDAIQSLRLENKPSQAKLSCAKSSWATSSQEDVDNNKQSHYYLKSDTLETYIFFRFRGIALQSADDASSCIFHFFIFFRIKIDRDRCQRTNQVQTQ